MKTRLSKPDGGEPDTEHDASSLSRIATACAAKAVFTAMGLGSIAWAASVWGAFSSALPLDAVSQRVIQTEPFRLQILRTLGASQVQGAGLLGARPENLREIAIINQRLLERDLVEGRRNRVDTQMETEEQAIEQSLRLAPADSFLWLTLYWLRTAKSGFSPQNLPLLDMSYRTGPNEGWVASRRNRFAFIVFDFLPPDLADMALHEFVTLVSSGYETEAANILIGPAWSHRDKLLALMDDVPLIPRQLFARKVYDLGYDVNVPGLPRSGERPWR